MLTGKLSIGLPPYGYLRETKSACTRSIPRRRLVQLRSLDSGASAVEQSGSATKGATPDAEGGGEWVCKDEVCTKDGVVVSSTQVSTPSSSTYELCLPEDYQLESGEVSTIARTPLQTKDIFRCTGCTKPECQGASGCGIPWRLEPSGYLRAILTSKVYDVAVETPLEVAPRLSEAVNNRIFLKREDLQPVFSFKIRGAYNKIASLTQEELDRGVMCASAGNHAQGVSLGAARRGARAVICMPTTTPAIKIASVKRLGGQVVLHGATYSDTATFAQDKSTTEGVTFVAPYDDPYVIAGQGTIGEEILRGMKGEADKLDAIFVAIGGGGLAAGVAAYVKALRPGIKVFGVEPTGSNAMAMSMQKGERVNLAQVDAFADGVAVKFVGAETFRLCRDLLDGVVLVNNSQISAAIKDVFNDTRSILEPAGAVAVAGAKAYLAREGCQGKTVVCVTSGANMNFDRLRLVSELADIGARSEAMLSTTIPEQPGAFRKFVEVGYYSSSGGTDIEVTEFKYRYNSMLDGEAQILHSVSINNEKQKQELVARLNAAGFPTQDLSEMEEAQVHLRHLVGGSAKGLTNEHMFIVEFPEKPGALGKFLNRLSPKWNVSAFHYRRSGNQTSNVLLGFQLPPQEREDFNQVIAELGKEEFSFKELSNEAYDAFKKFL